MRLNMYTSLDRQARDIIQKNVTQQNKYIFLISMKGITL